MCGFCDIQNADTKQVDLFSDEDINRYIMGIYNGSINLRNLDVHTYEVVARKLTEGVFTGYGKDMSNMLINSPDFIMLENLRENVYVFSGAKQYQQVRQMSDLLTNEGGIASFSDFQKKATNIFNDYNKNYLTAEYNSAIAQSRSASQWQEIQADKELYNQLQYVTANDGRVRPEHAILNNIIRPVDDKFWDMMMPPNGWNCRCDVMQTVGGVNTPKANIPKPTQTQVPDIFRFNAGKEKIVFSEKHPYFDIAPKDITFAKTNFGLPLPATSTPMPKFKPNVEKPNEVKPIVKTDEFVPAKDIKDAENRLKDLGIKKVSLKGLEKENMFNAVLKQIEDEHKISPVKLDAIKTVNRAKAQEVAAYEILQKRSTGEILNRAITINLPKITNYNFVPMATFEDEVNRLKKLIESYEEKNRLNKIDINSFNFVISNSERKIKDLEFKISQGEQEKIWTVSNSSKNSYDNLKTVMSHEIGHYRHEFNLNNTKDFSYSPSKSISRYGMISREEFFAEFYAKYKRDGSSGIPEDLLTLFKKIEK